jgi:tetratricopeptide (TPR) repeat protein
MAADPSFARERRAAGILDRVLAREPQHPGVAHYLIHSFDYPPLAHLALPAARRYAAIAPASAHAQHMPSHIFTRLGLWRDAIESNRGAEAAAKAYAARRGLQGAWDEQLHAADYLAYAHLQLGEDEQALAVLRELNGIGKVEPANFKVAYAFTAVPARYALERRDWAEAARLVLAPGPSAAVDLDRFPWARAHLQFARAVGAARLGDTAAARAELANLAASRRGLAAVQGDYDWGRQVEIEHGIAAAWLAHAEGRREAALDLMRRAAELDDATEKHPVTPGSILPAREQLGELLLEQGQPAAALQAFEASLQRAPNRFGGLAGAGAAAELAGDAAKAQAHHSALLALGRTASPSRPQVARAAAFLRGLEGSGVTQVPGDR